jgi:hypothetical protein
MVAGQDPLPVRRLIWTPSPVTTLQTLVAK